MGVSVDVSGWVGVGEGACGLLVEGGVCKGIGVAPFHSSDTFRGSSAMLFFCFFLSKLYYS